MQANALSAFLSRAAVLSLSLTAALWSTSGSAAADIGEVTSMLKAGKYLECADAAGAAIEEGQYSETWRILKIDAELRTGQYPEALSTLEAAFERFKTSVRLRWIGHRVYQFNAKPERAAEVLDEIDKLMDGGSWRFTDPASRVALGEFYLQRGVDAKDVLGALFNQVKKRNPEYSPAYIASGQLALSKHDYGLAAEEFEKAVKLDTTDADIHCGLAAAYAPSDPERSQQALETALERNPSHIDSLLFLADHHIDAESYDEARTLLDRALEVNMLEPRAWAYRAVLAHLDSDPNTEEHCRGLALSWWAKNPEVDSLIGQKLSQKYRFAEGAAYQRKALAFDPNYLPAKIQLSQDLLRLSKDEEGWRLANEVYEQDGYNVVAHNLVTLQDNISKYRLLEADGFLVRMEAREAEIYGPLVLDLLQRAKEHLCDKYQVTIDDPVAVEIFAKQEDFAIRTFGLPGGAGFLGVCFGRVITANSPASQTASPTNWQATLWHEFCHVVTLQKTKNKMPRWLSEGISVYEERQTNPSWGQSMTPQYREMILGDELTPVSQLSGAFLSPGSALHLQFAYYESSLVVEYLVEKHGIDVLKRILVDLGVGISINDALLRYTGSLAALDQEFAEFARDRARSLAPEADWEKPDVEQDTSPAEIIAWSAAHPDNFWGIQQHARLLLAARRWEDAKPILQRLLKLYPQSKAARTMLATVHRELNETDDELVVLKEIAEISADDVAAFERLMELCAEQGDWQSVAEYGDLMLAVDPLRPKPHRQLVRAAEQLGDDHQAISSLQALVVMDPIDPADVYYRLGSALHRAGDLAAARLQIVKALEEAPRFRAAHRELLEIVGKMKDNEVLDQPKTTPAEEKR
jgi:tetratricopeptide (TPR) repeat protein